MPKTEVELATEFDRSRPHLVRVAYAILGTRAEAEDVVAECWFTLVASNSRDAVRDVEAWATVVVARAALDTLRSARMRRETYVGPWLPEPVVAPYTEGRDPADQVSLDESVRFALMVVLERLTPAERTAWVLHEVFGLPFAEVADVVGRSPEAVRQLAHRARRHITDGSPRVHAGARTHRSLVQAFRPGDRRRRCRRHARDPGPQRHPDERRWTDRDSRTAADQRSRPRRTLRPRRREQGRGP